MTGWDHEGDIAKSVARQLQNEHLASIAGDGSAFVDEEPVMLAAGKSLFDKISFRWRSDEQRHLDRIRSSVDTVVAHMYGEAKQVIDDFYAELRVPQINPETGMVQRDRGGRIVWRRDERGKEIEHWDQMTGQDIERALMDLSRVRIDIAPKVNELLMEAVFAKHIHDDQYQDAFAELVEETIPGRNAYASRKTREDKYRAFFCYYLWSSAKVFQAEIDNFCWVLQKVRQWRIEGENGKTPPRV
jgi:hypothetical protein